MDALQAFWDGAFGSGYAFLSATLVRSTPLILLGLAVGVAFRAGILNIGAEGQLLAGAAAAALVALGLAEAPAPIIIALMIIAAAVAGASWAGIAAWLRHRFGVLEVVSTIMLNFIALHAIGWLVRGPLQEPTRVYPQSDTIVAAARWPLLVPGQRLHLGFVLALAAAVLTWFFFARTAAGFRARIVGAGAQAAASAGAVDPRRTIAGVFIASGALAGIAGAGEVGGVTWALYEGISPGYGYTAIAVALLARLDARWIVASGILFGALDAGAAAMQRDANVPSVVVQVVVALVILGVLTSGRWRQRVAVRRTPAAPETA